MEDFKEFTKTKYDGIKGEYVPTGLKVLVRLNNVTSVVEIAEGVIALHIGGWSVIVSATYAYVKELFKGNLP